MDSIIPRTQALRSNVVRDFLFVINTSTLSPILYIFFGSFDESMNSLQYLWLKVKLLYLLFMFSIFELVLWSDNGLKKFWTELSGFIISRIVSNNSAYLTSLWNFKNNLYILYKRSTAISSPSSPYTIFWARILEIIFFKKVVIKYFNNCSLLLKWCSKGSSDSKITLIKFFTLIITSVLSTSWI